MTVAVVYDFFSVFFSEILGISVLDPVQLQSLFDSFVVKGGAYVQLFNPAFIIGMVCLLLSVWFVVLVFGWLPFRLLKNFFFHTRKELKEYAR